MAYIGKQPLIGNFIKLDAITTSATATYNLLNDSVAVSPQSPNNCIVSLNGVIQAPTDAYTISGSQIIFDSALTASDTIDFILVLGDVLDVGTVSDDTITTAKIQDSAVTTAKINDLAVTDGKLAGSISNAKLANSSITINSQAIALGGSGTIDVTDTKPTISSLTPSVITNSATAVVIAGTGFVSIPIVEAINTSGAITPADSVSFTSATSITATFTLPVDGTYYIRVENNSGDAVRTSTAALTVSDEPTWVTASGSLGTFAGGSAISTITLTCTDATSFAVTSGAVTAGLTFTTGVGSATITGTQTAHTSAATDSFTVTATDAEGQTAARAFTITWSFGSTGGAQFN
tara:strand:+ start:461 stop:1507 length:1047 start_codon:yes stop_codon:yes gene_type:complete